MHSIIYKYTVKLKKGHIGDDPFVLAREDVLSHFYTLM